MATIASMTPQVSATNDELPFTKHKHPLAAQILRQIEYYFSDESLLKRGDEVYQFLQGPINWPVNIGRITKYRKIKDLKDIHTFNKTEVMEILKDSTTLNVTDKNHINRKVPVAKYDSSGDSSDSDYDCRDPNQRSKKQRKPKVVVPPPNRPPKGMSSVDGWEDNYADAPTTPAEAEAEDQLYDQSLPVHERLEFAIQRYRGRRKFHEKHTQCFSSFLKFGGIETRPKQFTGGLSREDMENMDTVEIHRATAMDFAGDDKEDESQWGVEFETVAKAFLSSHFPQAHWDYNTELVELQTRIMTNFYNYLLHHSVCPEYTDDINAAREICALALKELPIIKPMKDLLPGHFNTCVSVFLGGSRASLFSEKSDWTDDVQTTAEIRLPGAEARSVVNTGIIALANDTFLDAAGTDGEDGTVNYTEKLTFTASLPGVGLQVDEIVLPTDANREVYYEFDAKNGRKVSSLSPLGYLICKPFRIPDFAGQDLPRGYRSPSPEDKTITLWLEEPILKQCYVGMNMCCDLRKVGVKDVGKGEGEGNLAEGVEEIYILDQVTTVHCSFYTVIENEMSDKKCKEPRIYGYEEALAAEAKEEDGTHVVDSE
ncbi:hypothetical protein EJ08DRAFT_650782 [Tothia fuscella]|uniref:HTH La-type RNA-binding domain-containing protein n=1 Tax=Tothia fuscella TaxID=1048955 RepID=A0A9P4NNY9_9PEZI|nr:hypothetical protein EJ08DRAFT_650782 [Tothia fuscella]